MKIGCLQFSARLGEVQRNIDFVNNILNEAQASPDLLVLPELAFTGYNFPSLEAIRPYLEKTGAGPTSQWAMATAQKLNCHIIVGYPETCTEDGVTRNYNSTVTVSPSGQIVSSYRKSFLYYTDETWASEGPHGSAQRHAPSRLPFFCGTIPSLTSSRMIGHGICMDINPYRFAAPWDAYEFANCMVQNRVHLVVLCMAWLTRLLPQDLLIEPDKPDMETVAYWLERFWPFSHNNNKEDIIVVIANRCGIEGSADDTQTVGGHDTEQHPDLAEMTLGDRVCYAGSSCIMRFQGGSVRMYERSDGEVAIMGKSSEGLLVVDVDSAAKFRLQHTTT